MCYLARPRPGEAFNYLTVRSFITTLNADKKKTSFVTFHILKLSLNRTI